MKWRERATLLQADYRDTLAAIEGRADLVLTSPPYCDARTYGHAVSWTDEDYQRLGDAVFAALKPGGHALINVDAPVRKWRKGYGTERGFHPWRLMLDWGERVGFRVPDRLAFGRHGQPGKFWGFRNDWEPLLWFQRPGDGWTPDAGAIGKPTVPGTWRAKTRRRAQDGSSQWMTTTASNGIRRRGSLWQYGATGTPGQHGCPAVANANHPARWPYRLARDIVKCFCPPDGLACDPFVGAGTSLVAALDEGRRFHGGDLFERQEDGKLWVDVAAEIAEARYAQLALFGGLR